MHHGMQQGAPTTSLAPLRVQHAAHICWGAGARSAGWNAAARQRTPCGLSTDESSTPCRLFHPCNACMGSSAGASSARRGGLPPPAARRRERPDALAACGGLCSPGGDSRARLACPVHVNIPCKRPARAANRAPAVPPARPGPGKPHSSRQRMLHARPKPVQVRSGGVGWLRGPQAGRSQPGRSPINAAAEPPPITSTGGAGGAQTPLRCPASPLGQHPARHSRARPALEGRPAA